MLPFSYFKTLSARKKTVLQARHFETFQKEKNSIFPKIEFLRFRVGEKAVFDLLGITSGIFRHCKFDEKAPQSFHSQF